MSDCKQPHPVGEAPSRRAHCGIGQNHMPDGWAEAGARGCDRGVPGCEVDPTGASTMVGSTSMGLAPGGMPPLLWVGVCLHWPLRGVSRGGPRRGALRGRLDWRRGARRAVGRALVSRVRTGSADHGGATHIRHADPRLQLGAGPRVQCTVRGGECGTGACRGCRRSRWRWAEEGCGGGGRTQGGRAGPGQTAAHPASCPTSRVYYPGARCPCVCAPS